ncbi:MAG: methyltransferase [Bacteroidales bacterium]|nr:methyltransferase [Bacteroidales bacterium]
MGIEFFSIEIGKVLTKIFVAILELLFPRLLRTNNRIYHGYYVTSWQKANNQPQKDFIRLNRLYNKVFGRTLYTVDPETRYIISGNISDQDVFLGNWENQKYSYKFGAIQVRPIDESNTTNDGKWIGSTIIDSRIEVFGGEFTLNSREINNKDPFHNLVFNKRKFIKNVGEILNNHLSMYSGVRQTHDLRISFPDIDSILDFQLYNGVFNPNLGHFSKKLLEYSCKYEPKTVLDIGTGCGYFAAYFSLIKNAKVVATDIDARAIECARQNFYSLNINITELIGNLYEPVYKKFKLTKKFDLIIANLPFSKRRYIQKASKSSKFSSKRLKNNYIDIFACTYNTSIRDLILGAEYFLNPGGHLVFIYGGSGHHKLLREGINISHLKKEHIKDITTNESSESLMIFDLKLS